MSELYQTFLISLAVSAIMDAVTELLRYCRKSKCKSNCKCMKLECNDPTISNDKIIP